MNLILDQKTSINTMVTESAINMFEIHVDTFLTWEKRPHKHNFFEIVYVEKGAGFQCINQHEFEYQEGNIFLLPPLDCHSFKIKAPSKFYFIRFTDHYFLKNKGLANYQNWFGRIAYILANYNRVPGDIIGSERERHFIIQNIKFIYQEYLLSDHYSDSITTEVVASILNILARSIEKKYVKQANEMDSRFGEILRYIHTHILESEKLRLPVLADQFHIAKSYFSEYFKKHAGINLADYILTSKLRIAKTKLLHTDLSLKEIAYQLNFTDSSHMAKAFKKVYGLTIKEFKRNDQMCQV